MGLTQYPRSTFINGRDPPVTWARNLEDADLCLVRSAGDTFLITEQHRVGMWDRFTDYSHYELR